MGGKIFLKDHVIPHIYKCQADIKRHLPPENSTTKRSKNTLVDILLNRTPEGEESELEIESRLKPSNTTPEFQMLEHVLPEDLLSSKFNMEDKCTQTVCIKQRIVSVQCKPNYRSKFVQTDIVIVTNFNGDCPNTIV